MQKIILALTLLCQLAVWNSTSVAQSSASEAAATELQFITRVFSTGYAPTNWKKIHLNWDLKAEYSKALAMVQNKSNLSALEYRSSIASLLKSTHDYHVGYSFYTTEAAKLPFLVSGANGRYFIVWINEEKLNKATFPFQVGDELVNFGSQTVAAAVDEIKAIQSGAADSTDQRLAELLLTSRSAKMNLPVPSGQIIIEAKRVDPASGKDIKIVRELTWDYTPELVEWKPSFNTGAKVMAAAVSDGTQGILSRPQMKWGMQEDWASSVDAVENPFQIGGRKSWVPVLGTVIWQADDKDLFHSYIYRNAEGKLIGYVRIPAYDGQDGKSFEEFKKLIKRFQTTTDALVIDEVNNPGGSVFYVYALMSVLSVDPIKVPDHAISLWPQMILDNAEAIEKLSHVTNDEESQKFFGGKTIDGFPVTYTYSQSALAFARQVDSYWKSGYKLTPPLFFEGVDRVNPDPEVNYSKPIVVLINELDFSGGDFFPAILQDNNRAKTFGQRTSGAGGYIIGVDFPSSLGLKKFSFTGSIARRVNNNPIENLGVTPDYPYQLSVTDLKDGFSEYKDAVNAAVKAEILAH